MDNDNNVVDLFARRTDPQTSHDAAAHATTKSSERVKKIIRVLQAQPNGATSAEIAHMLGVPRDFISPLMPKLEEKDMVHRTDARRRDAHSKQKQIVWYLGKGTTKRPCHNYRKGISEFVATTRALMDAETQADKDFNLGRLMSLAEKYRHVLRG